MTCAIFPVLVILQLVTKMLRTSVENRPFFLQIAASLVCENVTLIISLLPACRRLLFPLLHACNKGNRRRLHAGKSPFGSQRFEHGLILLATLIRGGGGISSTSSWTGHLSQSMVQCVKFFCNCL